MKDFERPTSSFEIIRSEEFSLSDQAFCLQSDFLTPFDQIGKINVESEVLLARVLVGVGRKEAHVVSIGTECSEGATVVDFF